MRTKKQQAQAEVAEPIVEVEDLEEVVDVEPDPQDESDDVVCPDEEESSEDTADDSDAPVDPDEDSTDPDDVIEPDDPCEVDEEEIEQTSGEIEVADESTLSIDAGVVEKIVAMTCRNVDGLLQMKGSFISSIQEGLRGSDITKGVSVEMSGDDGCTVSVAIIMEYGKSAPRIFQEVHDKVSSAITRMTGLRVNAVNVRVTNVMTRAEIENGRRRDKSEE